MAWVNVGNFLHQSTHGKFSCFIKIRIIYFAVKFEHLCLLSVQLDFVFFTPSYVHVYSGRVARSCSHSSLGFLMRDLNHSQSNLHRAQWMGEGGVVERSWCWYLTPLSKKCIPPEYPLSSTFWCFLQFVSSHIHLAVLLFFACYHSWPSAWTLICLFDVTCTEVHSPSEFGNLTHCKVKIFCNVNIKTRGWVSRKAENFDFLLSSQGVCFSMSPLSQWKKILMFGSNLFPLSLC